MPILKEGKMTLFSNTNVAIVAKFLVQTPAYKSITDHILEKDPLSAISVAIGKKILILILSSAGSLNMRGKGNLSYENI